MGPFEVRTSLSLYEAARVPPWPRPLPSTARAAGAPAGAAVSPALPQELSYPMTTRSFYVNLMNRPRGGVMGYILLFN